MNQQINLYVRHEKISVPFSALSCLMIVVVSTAVLLAVFVYNLRGIDQLEQDLASVRQQEQQLQQTFDRVQQAMVVPKESPVLLAQLQRIESEISAKRRFDALLDQLQPERRILFSAVFDGLAEQIPDGIWLTGIEATASGRKLTLEGATLQPALVPRLLKRLGSEAVYRQARFDELQLKQEEERWLSFQVSADLRPGVVR